MCVALLSDVSFSTPQRRGWPEELHDLAATPPPNLCNCQSFTCRICLHHFSVNLLSHTKVLMRLHLRSLFYAGFFFYVDVWRFQRDDGTAEYLKRAERSISISFSCEVEAVGPMPVLSLSHMTAHLDQAWCSPCRAN